MSAKIGIFGNSDIAYAGDWTAVVNPDIEKSTGTFDEKTSSCFAYSSMRIEIITSKVGRRSKPQEYVVTVRAIPV